MARAIDAWRCCLAGDGRTRIKARISRDCGRAGIGHRGGAQDCKALRRTTRHWRGRCQVGHIAQRSLRDDDAEPGTDAAGSCCSFHVELTLSAASAFRPVPNEISPIQHNLLKNRPGRFGFYSVLWCGIPERSIGCAKCGTAIVVAVEPFGCRGQWLVQAGHAPRRGQPSGPGRQDRRVEAEYFPTIATVALILDKAP